MEIVNFDFGQSFTSLDSQDEGRNKLEPDNLILVDAFWEISGMKIRFIPHQMKTYQKKSITLKVIFVFEFNDSYHDKDAANYELEIESPDTVFSKQKSSTINIKGSSIKKNLLKFRRKTVTDDDGRPCYYYEINNFSSDLLEVF